MARKFGCTFRFIDDLLALNDGHAFESFHHEIYPEELVLNKENDSNNETNFLDLHIKIENGAFNTILFDKRNDFGFNIARLPYKSSNIPCRMFMRVSQLRLYVYAERHLPKGKLYNL